MPPEPIDGRRAATEPTDDPRCARARAAHLTARRLALSPRPRRDPPFGSHPSCRTNASRANASRAYRRETHRDAAHRTIHPRCPPPRTVTAPPTRPHVHPRRPFVPPELPHGLTSPCRPSLSTGDAPRRSPPDDPSAVPAATHRHRAPDATPRPPAPPFCSTRAAARPHEPMPPEPIDGRRTATVAAPRPCSAPVCRRSAKTLGTPLPRALSASAERPWFASASEKTLVTPVLGHRLHVP